MLISFNMVALFIYLFYFIIYNNINKVNAL